MTETATAQELRELFSMKEYEELEEHIMTHDGTWISHDGEIWAFVKHIECDD